jgi:putative transposase
MARPLRVSFSGAIYHVMARGNNKQAIFLDEVEYREVLHLLRIVVKRFGIVCHIYCLMPNHYHIVVETPAGNLSAALQWLNGEYARWWNKRHGRCGHVFQGRFKAQLVQRDRYLHALRDYVDWNPVEGGLVATPAEWEWSSYRAYAGLAAIPDFLTTDLVYGLIGASSAPDKGLVYRSRGANPRVLAAVTAAIERDDRWIGDDAAFDGHRREAARQVGGGISRRELLLSAPPLADLLRTGRSKGLRNAQMNRAHRQYGYRIADIAEHLKLNRSTIVRAIRSRGRSTRTDGSAPEADGRVPTRDERSRVRLLRPGPA